MTDNSVLIDFIANGRANGDVASVLMASGGDPRPLRPFVGEDDRSYVMVDNDRGEEIPLVTNTPATLRIRDWMLIDEAIIRAAKPRLRAVADLRGMGLQMTIPNGMGKTVFQYQTQSDISPAQISMDGVREGPSDRPMFDIGNLPLPIIHKDFQFSARQVMESRNNNHTPIDTTSAELAARRVAEQAEQWLLGVVTQYTYGGGSVYGYTNFGSRMTYSLTLPTSATWTPLDTVNDLLAMRTLSQRHFHYGPWMCYCSLGWDTYMDGDYSAAKGDNTLRERLAMIDGIIDVRTLDYLPDYTLLLVQMSSDVARMVVGMDIATVQWQSQGGMLLNFKVMCIMVPQVRADFNGNTGIVHGS